MNVTFLYTPASYVSPPFSYTITGRNYISCPQKFLLMLWVNYKFQNRIMLCLFFVSFWRDSPQFARASSFQRFLDHTQLRTTVGRIPLYERSSRRRDLYLTTHNTHNRQTFLPTVGFEPTISIGERPQTYDLDRAATWTCVSFGGFKLTATGNRTIT